MSTPEDKLFPDLPPGTPDDPDDSDLYAVARMSAGGQSRQVGHANIKAEFDGRYDPLGTAAAAVAAHEAAGDPHSQYLTQAEADPLYDASGTAAAAVAAHEAAPDPHSQYLTNAEGDAAYEPIGETDSHRGTTDEHPTFTSSQPGFATAPGAGTNTRYMAPDGSWPELPANGTSTFTGLTDTPSSYAGESGKFAAVNGGENGLEFVDPPTGSGDVTITGNTVDDDVMLGAAASKGIKNSGVQINSVQLAISGGTNGNLVSRDAAGKVQDAGVSPSDFDAAGTAAAAVAAHEAAGDPHSQYQTEAESDARYGQLAAVNAWTQNQQYNGVGLISAQAGRFSLTYAPDGIYDPLDGGFEAAEGASILLGTVTEVASLKHASGESQQVYVTENGELFGVDPPEPAWSISATDSTDTTAGSGGGQSGWEVMGFTPALVLPQDVTPSDEIQVDTRIYWANLASNASGTVSIGFGIDGADPVAPGATEQLGQGFAGPIPTSWTVTGLTLTTGQTLSLFMRRESGSSGQFNPVAQGTTQAHTVTIRDRREGGTGGDGDVTGPGSATPNNFASFDGPSGKLIQDSGVSAASFDPINSAATEVSNHEAAPDPHPQYLTQAEGDARYQLTGGQATFRTSHNYVIGGSFDNTKNVPRFYVGEAANQTSSTIKIIAFLESGNSITGAQLLKNGTPIAGLDNITITSGGPATIISETETLADEDYLKLNFSSAFTGAVDLTFAVIVESTVTVI